MNRRTVLGTLGSALTGTMTGCRGSSSGQSTTTATPTTTGPTSSGTDASTTTGPTSSGTDASTTTGPTSSETDAGTMTAPPCEKGGAVVDGIRVEYGTLAGFDLTANKERIEVGEQITFRLENGSNEDRESGVKSKYTIHRKTRAGWRDVFYPSDGNEMVGYQDLPVNHPPGEGFTWQLTFSRSGLARDIEDGIGSLDVCTPLRAGTYRFVYWGVTTEREIEAETEDALGVRFSVSK